MVDADDVTTARHFAEDQLAALTAYGRAIEDGSEGDAALATLIAARAICAAVRALELTLAALIGIV